MRLALGTVQFGLDYGISNQVGQTNIEEARKILSMCQKNNIDTLDTAQAYGESETVLGKLSASKNFKIITKCFNPKGQLDSESIHNGFEHSLSNLKTPSVYGLLIHNIADFINSPKTDGVFQALESLKSKNKVKRIGVSVYTGEEIDVVLSKYKIDLIQLPFNILDQKLKKSGHLRRLKDSGVEIHCRSIFLQGLLVMPLTDIPSRMKGAIPHLQKFHQRARELNMTPLELALNFGIQTQEIDKVVIGVNTSLQLSEIINAVTKSSKLTDCDDLNCSDEAIVNPKHWPKE